MPGLLPTLLTLSNGVCGLASIAVATGALGGLPLATAAFFAAMLIFLGMLFDMLDGQVARALKQTSQFGVQLDSLCDAITFGAAPVFVLMAFRDVFHPRFLFGIGVAYAACALLRLARFNVETTKKDSHDFFTGLPSPAAAGTIASFALALPQVEQWTDPSASAFTQLVGTSLLSAMMLLLPPLTLLLAWLMVSRISYRHVVNRWMGGRYRFYQMSCVVLAIILVVAVHELAVPLVFCLYALEPARQALWKRCQARLRPTTQVANLDDTNSSGDGVPLDTRHPDAPS
ncbi:MAG: CDP-alcohol phosphatidyltransferase family protein [Planctomycetes bacterium]|nr:CDP-alcohol phosphatidyltransferase family protein [Planctomycetota bacterium]